MAESKVLNIVSLDAILFVRCTIIQMFLQAIILE